MSSEATTFGRCLCEVFNKVLDFFCSAVGGDKTDAFDDYAFYGGMPLILSRPTEETKMNYLQSLVSEVYLKDIVEHKKIKREDVLASILDLLCSSVGYILVQRV